MINPHQPQEKRVAVIGSVPPNSLDYFAIPGQQLPLEVTRRIIEGPLTAMQNKLTAEILKPGE